MEDNKKKYIWRRMSNIYHKMNEGIPGFTSCNSDFVNLGFEEVVASNFRPPRKKMCCKCFKEKVKDA